MIAEKIDPNFGKCTPKNITNMAAVDEQLLHERHPKITEVRSAPSDDTA